jgi:hypothetical protein
MDGFLRNKRTKSLRVNVCLEEVYEWKSLLRASRAESLSLRFVDN